MSGRKRAALYARVSTRDKEQDPEVQLRILRQWAHRQDLEPEEYIDFASGKDLNRPGWQRMMADMKAGRVDVIAVLRLDRAFRSVLDMSVSLQALQARGVRFAAATQDLDTSTATGKLLVNLLGSFGEFERVLSSERIKEGMAKSSKKPGRPRKVGQRRLVEAVKRLGVRGADRELGITASAVSQRVKKSQVRV